MKLANSMKIQLGLIGKGNVGTSLLELLYVQNKYIEKQFSIHLKVVVILEYDGALLDNNGLDLFEIIELGENFRESKYWKAGVKIQDIISAQHLDILIETTPTNVNTGEPGLSHIRTALQNKINVVSSNKGPFYLEYDPLKSLAKDNDVILKYEATVASAVPALSIKNNLRGNEIIGIKAILNGTSNYILSRMASEGMSFSIALKEAQELGYAEADSRLDIEGYDAAGKIVILANELLEWSKTIQDVKIKGISGITPHAIELARSEGYVIKPLAVAEDNHLIVEPRLIEKDSPLNIGGMLNVIELQTKFAGPVILTGRGAGGSEAASAILNDLMFVIQELINKEEKSRD